MIVCRAHCVWDSFRYRKATTKKLCRERSCQNNRNNGDTEVAWRRAVSSNTPVLPRDPTLATTLPLRRSRGLLPPVSDRCTWEPKSQRNGTEAKEHSIIKQHQSHARAQQVLIRVPRGQIQKGPVYAWSWKPGQGRNCGRQEALDAQAVHPKHGEQGIRRHG